MILLLIPLMNILALSFYCLTAREKRWQEDKERFRWEAMQHQYYEVTGEFLESWSRQMPSIRIKGRES